MQLWQLFKSYNNNYNEKVLIITKKRIYIQNKSREDNYMEHNKMTNLLLIKT